MEKSEFETRTIRELNDEFRKNWILGVIAISAGISLLDPHEQIDVAEKVMNFDFEKADPGDNPYKENDFGTISLKDGTKVFFKIEYYSATQGNGYQYLSVNAAARQSTNRVLHIMLASEY